MVLKAKEAKAKVKAKKSVKKKSTKKLNAHQKYSKATYHPKVAALVANFIKDETSDKVLTDETLCELVKSKKVWCSPNIIFAVRKEMKISASMQRRIQLFAKGM